MKKAAASTGDPVVHTQMNDGTAMVLRPIRPDDEQLLRDGIAKLSAESRYLRFFSHAPTVPDAIIEKLVDVDGMDHIAWGAICTGCPQPFPIGAVHAVRHQQHEGAGEYSIGILDAFHGQGIARILTAALLIDCMKAGIAQLDVYILTENRAASSLVRSMGAVRRLSGLGTTELQLDVAKAIKVLRQDDGAIGLKHVFRQLYSDP